MGKQRIFTTAPTRAISDDRLSGLDLRVLLVIALHDGMSQLKGNKPGCYASPPTLAKFVGVDATSYARTATRLVNFGYITREKQKADSRRSTIRVLYVAEDICPDRQISGDGFEGDPGPEIVDDLDKYPAEIVDDWENNPAEIVDIGVSETRGNLPKTQTQYIPLKGEIDSDESEIDSPEGAQFENCGEFADDIVASIYGDAGSIIGSAKQSKKDAAKAGRSSELSIAAYLPRNMSRMSLGAVLVRLEGALKAIDWRYYQLPKAERKVIEEFLWDAKENSDNSVAGHADRLLDQIAALVETAA